MMRRILIFLSVCVLAIVVFSGAFLWDAFLKRPASDAKAIEVTIPEGSSVNTIASTLIDKQMLDGTFFFKLFVRLQNVTGRLQAGTFEFKPGMSLSSIVSVLSNAKDIEVQVTIPEGYTAKQISQTFTSTLKQFDQKEWETLTSNATTVTGFDFLATIPSGQGLEGYLFPDTYRFRNDVNAKTVIETMLFTFKRRFAENNLLLPNTLVFPNGMSLHEVMTLASIVEREVQSPEDMKHVAGIFLTRLEIGMAIQADSTVNYVTGKTTPGISLADTQLNSPYNTYRYLGLPPGPISNPGMNAIRAVLEPFDSDDVYFLTTPDGRVMYAKTFAEHVSNKQRYLK